MDSLPKNTPRLSSAKCMLSSAIFSYRTLKDVEGGVNIGGQKCPWKFFLGLGHLIFSLIDSLQKKEKYPLTLK